MSIYRRRIEMKSLFKRLWKEESGQDLTEYALLLVLIALVAVAALQGLATAINAVYTNVAANLTGHVP
jgi:pilus assembly protein Flp/PilA